MKKGDYIKFPDELKSLAKTSYDFGLIERIENSLVEVVFVNAEDVKKDKEVHEIKEFDGLTFSFSSYDIPC